MATTVDVNTVLQAIDALYLNPDPSYKEQASRWLSEFQKSLNAWEISDQLLYMRRDLNSCYFGAQTIRKKIQCHFTELPAGSHEALKNSLMEHVKKLSGDTSVPIANQLCLAVADLFCHMVQWNNGIKEIIDSLSLSDVSCGYLIDILKFIPEEMVSSTLRLGLNRRRSLMAHLENNKARVIELLATKTKTAQMPLFTRIYNCLASWWDNSGVMCEQDIAVSPLLESAFWILKNPLSTPESAYDAVTTWISALLYDCRTYSEASTGLLKWLQTNIYELVKVIHDCAGSSQTYGTEQLELLRDRCSCLAHIFSSLTQTLRPSLVDHPTNPGSGSYGDLNTLNCLLVILELSPPLGNRDLAAVTFYALHSLADDAFRHRSVIAPNNFNAQNADQPDLRPVSALVPYFTRIVVALMRFCPSSTADASNADELHDFREDVYDLMQDILSIVGADALFVKLFTHIQGLVAPNTATQSSPTEVLQAAEACLFMLTTVAKRLSPLDPEGRISTLVSDLVLPGLSSSPYPIQEVGCLLYMELSHWASCHPQLSRQIVTQLIEIVEKAAGVEANNLQPGQKRAVGAALSALGSLCSIYRPAPSGDFNGLPANSVMSSPARVGLLDEHWQALVERVAYQLPRLCWVPAYDATNFFTGVGRGLIASVGVGGKEFDPRPARRAFPSRLAQICSVSLECLSKLMDNNVTCVGVDTLTDPRVWLDYLAAVFRTCGVLLRRLDDGSKSRWSGTELASLTESAEQCLRDCIRLVKEAVWPVVSRVIVHYANHSRPIEHACRLVRFVVRCFSVHLRELLPDIAEKIVVAYTTGGQHSSFLYLSSVLVDEFGELPDCSSGLVRVFETVGGPTLKMLEGPNLAQQPHTVEDLYRFCTRLVQHCPVAFFCSQSLDLNLLCQTAIQSLNLYSPTSSANGGDDVPGAESDSNHDSRSNSASAAAAARFLIDLLSFTAEASESTSSEVAQALSAGGPLPNVTSQSGMAAQRVQVWLTQSAGQQLVSACLQACCLGSAEDRIPELADILYRLKVMTKNDLFLSWLDNAVSALPTQRSDGFVQATPQQVYDFKALVVSASKSSELISALSKFSVLFQ